MPEALVETTIKRILVALDASTHSLAALEAAAQLAAALQAEIQGLFVEDDDLMRAAALPFTREVRPLSHAPRTFDHASMRRTFRAQAGQARRALEAVAIAAGVDFSFRVSQGQVALELLSAAAEADLLTLGQASIARCSRRKLGTTARTVVSQASGPVLLLRRGLHLDLPVAAVYDGSEQAERALHLAYQLARQDASSPLTVLVLGDDAETVHHRRQAVTEHYGERMPHLHIRPLTDTAIARLAEVVHEEEAGVLALPIDSAFLQNDRLPTLLTLTSCPVLLAR